MNNCGMEKRLSRQFHTLELGVVRVPLPQPISKGFYENRS